MTIQVRIASGFDPGLLGSPMYLSSLASATPIQIVGFGALPTGATPIRWCSPAAPGAVPAKIVGYDFGWRGGAAPTYPVNTVAPVASGALTVGSTLSVTNGTWTNSPTGYTYQWLRNGANISGATSATYVTVSADGGTNVSCLVTATNANGSSSAASNALAIAAATGSTWSAADAAATGSVLSNGNMTVAPAGWNIFVRGTTSHSSGKWYVEFQTPEGATFGMVFGVASAGADPTQQLGTINYSVGMPPGLANNVSTGFTSHYTIGGNMSAGGVRQLAVDFDTGNIWVGYNNSWDTGNSTGSNPSTGAFPLVSFVPATVGPLFPAVGDANNHHYILQATAASQTYAPPTGFTAWDSAAAPSAPVNTTAPVISGTATVGSTLSCTTGVWTGSPTSYAYQWRRGGVNISGATSSTYVTVSADGGTSVTCVVTATNAGGSTPATSNALSIVALPVNTGAPVIAGTPQVGQTLTLTSPGTWTNSPTSYSYQWLNAGGPVAGATSSTYVIVAGDIGSNMQCRVQAINAAGTSASAYSNSLGPVTAVTTIQTASRGRRPFFRNDATRISYAHKGGTFVGV